MLSPYAFYEKSRSQLAVSRRRLLIAAVCCLSLAGMRSHAADPQRELHVLFIGNSFTHYNEMPKMVAELAKAGGQGTLHVLQETPGGYTLERHWQEKKAIGKLKSRHWDYVVLQDQSQAPLSRREAMFEYGKKFEAEIKKQGGETIFYQTWALLEKPENQPAISRAYEDLAKEVHAKLAPVGNAWKTAFDSDAKLVLHSKDKKHPNAAGSYLAACVFYATIYGKSPEGLPGKIGKLSDAEAKKLQAVAWSAVQAARK